MTSLTLRCHRPLGQFPLDVDVTARANVMALFGPSGAGKTSLLEIIAGLRRPLNGHIEVDGRVLFSSAQRVEVLPRHRRIGYVPQELALFPHLSVRKNMLYGQPRGGRTGHEPLTLEHVSTVLEIHGLLDRPIHSLSGGEAQRVALGRAILSRPSLLLLDEPLASLDIPLREKILPYLKRVRETFTVPMIYVTHHPQEILALADWTLVMARGRVINQGPPDAVLPRAHGPGLTELEEI